MSGPHPEPDYSRTMHSMPAPKLATTSATRLPVLVVMRGTQVGRRYLLNESGLVLGRSAERASLFVPGDRQISSAHCRFESSNDRGTWQVIDLASTNGTLVGGHKIATMELRDGDRILVGETVLKFTFHDEFEEEYYRQVDQLMNIDDLTGLPVQRVFQQRFEDVLGACAHRAAPMAVFMMDMDGLKRINDLHGHLMGAHVISTVGRRLGRIIQAARGVCSRFGGDEFSAFVPDCDREAALALGERLRCAVSGEPIAREQAQVQPTISIGVACHPQQGNATNQLTRAADEALYRAKAAGRNRVCE